MAFASSSIFPLDSNVIACWSFQNTATNTTVTDDAQNYNLTNNLGSAQDSIVTGSNSLYGNHARQMTGTGSPGVFSATNIGSSLDTMAQGNYTMEAIVKFNSFSTQPTVFGLGGQNISGQASDNQRAIMWIDSTGHLSSYWQNGVTQITSACTTALTTGVWYYLAWTKTFSGGSNTVAFYINGNLINSVSSLANFSVTTSINTAWQVGRYWNNSTSFQVNGIVQGCCFTTTARTATDISNRAIYLGFKGTPVITTTFDPTTSGIIDVNFVGAGDPATAATLGNYSISGSPTLTLTGVTYSGTTIGSQIIGQARLAFTGSLPYGKPYIVTISGVKDAGLDTTLSSTNYNSILGLTAMGLAGANYPIPNLTGKPVHVVRRAQGDNQQIVSSNQSGSSGGGGGSGANPLQTQFNPGFD